MRPLGGHQLTPELQEYIDIGHQIGIDSYSHNGGKAALERMGALDEVHELIEVWEAHAGQGAYGDRKAAAAEVGDWELQTQIDLGPYEAPHTERLELLSSMLE